MSEFMQRAIDIAQFGCYATSPNPNVGCVIVKDGKIIAEGYHEQFGGPHAEINALSQVSETDNVDLYVTLEPCCHFGNTPPCTQAIINARVRRVFIAMLDPNPVVHGRGVNELRAAGIEVHVDVLRQEAVELNRGFISRIERKRPWVTLKIASSIDGKIAMSSGDSKWITNEVARRDVQDLRAKSDAIITGSNTVIVDNPRLDIRDVAAINPCRVVIDSGLKTPHDAKIYDNTAQVIIATCNSELPESLIQQHIDVWCQPKVVLYDLLKYLSAEYLFNYVMVEAGAGLNTALLNAGLVDEVVLYLAPKVFGKNSLNMFNEMRFTDIDLAPSLKLHSLCDIDDNIKVVLRV